MVENLDEFFLRAETQTELENEANKFILPNECDIVRDLLPSYADKACAPHTRTFVSEHLEKCAECRKTLNNMQEDVTVSKIVDPEADLYTLRKAIKQKLRNEVILLTVLFTAIACALSFWFIARTVEDSLRAESYAMYSDAVEAYESARESGEAPGNSTYDKAWEAAENQRQNG